MTIQEAIAFVNDIKPNQYKQPHFVRWISEVEGIIWNEVIQKHQDTEDVSFSGYSENTDTSTTLLAPDPYCVLYTDYMCAMIDFYNGEFTRYNNSMTKYNASYQAFADYWNREHKSIGLNKMKL